MILYHAEILLTLEGQDILLLCSGLKGHRIIVAQAMTLTIRQII